MNFTQINVSTLFNKQGRKSLLRYLVNPIMNVLLTGLFREHHNKFFGL